MEEVSLRSVPSTCSLILRLCMWPQDSPYPQVSAVKPLAALSIPTNALASSDSSSPPCALLLGHSPPSPLEGLHMGKGPARSPRAWLHIYFCPLGKGCSPVPSAGHRTSPAADLPWAEEESSLFLPQLRKVPAGLYKSGGVPYKSGSLLQT